MLSFGHLLTDGGVTNEWARTLVRRQFGVSGEMLVRGLQGQELGLAIPLLSNQVGEAASGPEGP